MKIYLFIQNIPLACLFADTAMREVLLFLPRIPCYARDNYMVIVFTNCMYCQYYDV